MKRRVTILLVIIMIVCFGGAISYPLLYQSQKNDNEADMEDLRVLRNAGLEKAGTFPSGETVIEDGNEPLTEVEPTEYPEAESMEQFPRETAPAELTPDEAEEQTEIGTVKESVEADPVLLEKTTAVPTKKPENVSPSDETEESSAKKPGTDEELSPIDQPIRPRFEGEPVSTPEPYSGALPYPQKQKETFDESRILPQYRDIYALNRDTVGWLKIDGTGIDHPVLQSDDDDYYLKHDFYGRSNLNGQLLIFGVCDVYTPSYNVVISAHNMRSGKMFGRLMNYASRSFWNNHKIFTFDNLMREGTYVVVAAFYSADYNENEEGFRYLADIQYPVDYREWIKEVRENAIYETGIDTGFGDEFLTLTTCAYQRRNGRFVVIARRLREGEVIE